MGETIQTGKPEDLIYQKLLEDQDPNSLVKLEFSVLNLEMELGMLINKPGFSLKNPKLPPDVGYLHKQAQIKILRLKKECLDGILFWASLPGYELTTPNGKEMMAIRLRTYDDEIAKLIKKKTKGK